MERHVWHCWTLIRCPRLVVHLSTTMVHTTGKLVVNGVVEDVNMAASLVRLVVQMVVAVQLVVARRAAAVHLVDLGNSLGIAVQLVVAQDTQDTLVAVHTWMVAQDTHLVVAQDNLARQLVDLGNSLEMLVVVVVVPEGGVALEEAAPPLGKSSATGVAGQATLLPNVKMLWQMW